MPRDSSGNMTLPAGNPVVADTKITTAWANPTMSDLASEIEDSLSRSGKGGMLVPFQHSDGTAVSPGITFTNQTGSGLYRPSGGVGVSVIGVLKQLWEAALTTFKTAVKMESTLEVTGVATFTATPVLSAGISGITNASLPAKNDAISSSTAGWNGTLSSLAWEDVSNATVTITTTGRPVCICLVPDANASFPSYFGGQNVTGAAVAADFHILRGSTLVGWTTTRWTGPGAGGSTIYMPASAFTVVDRVAAGTYTYKLQGYADTNTTARVVFCKLYAYEL